VPCLWCRNSLGLSLVKIIRLRLCRLPFSCCGSLLEPVRVPGVAQVAPYAARIVVDAGLPVVHLALLAFLALFP
jgi:hypothetical protein